MLAFNSPWYLLLLALLPAMWWFSFRSLSGLGRWRRLFALSLRTLVLTLIVCALAEMQFQRTSDRLTVIYLLDQSLSIPEEARAAMIRYTNASIREQRKKEKDRAGVIVFAKNAEVELPPVEFSIELAPRIESLLDQEFTNLAGGMQRAMAMFPHDAAKRIVLVTDGNQNVGDALEQARAMADASVSIDAVPVMLQARSEVSVEKVVLPVDVRRDQPFELRVVLNNEVPEGVQGGRTVSGKVRVVRKAVDRETTIAEGPVTLGPGKHIIPFSETITQPDFITYVARFTPDDPADDPIAQNNEATAFTHVRGKGQVLLIENWEEPGEFAYLADRLRNEGLEVVEQPSNRLFSSLPELQRYDTVILANVPRTGGEDTTSVSSFTDAQIRMLVRNTEELGCGLIMLGGSNSFGAGGWSNTELEKAMPVDFEIKSSEVVPIGALVLNMHASEIPQANYWQKVIAQEAIKALGSRDYAGLISWVGTDQWLWAQSQGGMVPVGPNRAKMLQLIDRMSVGDMPSFDPSMQKAAAAFAKLPDAAIKHMIIISDGDPGDPLPSTVNALKQANVTVTTVLVGDPRHAPNGRTVMQAIANATGGKFYAVNSPNALPKIYQREARRVARPLMFEPKPPVRPRITTRHEIVQGLEDSFPSISGFVLTTVKENPLVEVVLRSPTPVDPSNSTILAAWTYGLGKTVAFTTDAGQRWANDWTAWPQYDRFFSQMVRWSMRPSGETGKYTVATDVQAGKTRVIISALDKEDEFLNYQTMSGAVLGPDMESIPLEIQQTAPGRYVGEFASSDAGSYMILVSPGAGQDMIRTGVNIGYSEEYRDRQTNLPLLESLARLSARGGEAGNLLPPLTNVPERNPEQALAPVLAFDPFRRDLPKAVASQDIWYWLVLVGSCVFLADVFVRRVQVSFLWLAPAWSRALDFALRRERQAPAPEIMSRLRSRKAEVDRSIESRRAAARFEPDAAVPVDPQTLSATEAKPTAGRPSQAPTQQPVAEEPPPDSYTSRLLKAKKQVWKDRGLDQDKDRGK